MTWKIKWDIRATNELRELEKDVQNKILSEMAKTTNDPRRFGERLSYGKIGLWVYKVGSYRMICTINVSELVILVLSVRNIDYFI